MSLPVFWPAKQPTASLRVPVPSSDGCYVPAVPDKELRQSELITDLNHYVVEADPADPNAIELIANRIKYSFILTPDCDLLQDYKSRTGGGDPKLGNVLLFQAELDDTAKVLSKFNGKEWAKVRTNEIERYHYFNPICPEVDHVGVGIDQALVIDFRRYYTLPPQEIERQCRKTAEDDLAVRRCFLSELWREHLQRRAMSYMQRVALPDIED